VWVRHIVYNIIYYIIRIIGVALGESQASKYAWPNAYYIYALMSDRLLLVLDVKVIPKQFLNFTRKKRMEKWKNLRFG